MSEPPIPNRADDQHSTHVTNVSGGVNIDAEQVNIGGDAVGRDKISNTQNIVTGGGADISGNVTMSDGSEFVGRDKTINNFRQFIMSPWAWFGGILILVIGLTLVAGIFNIGPLQSLFPKPTPMAFAPAAEGQSLIIVANFEDRSSGRHQGIDPAQYVYEQLAARAKSDRLNVRVERLRQVVDDNTVRTAGNVYSATLILWGWYDALTITPRIEQIKASGCCNSTAGEKRFSIADNSTIEVTIVQDLPTYTTYIVLLTLGLDRSAHDDLPRALDYFQSANASNVDGASLAEIYLQRGNVYYRLSDYDSAIADYDRAIQLNPTDANAFNNRGVVYAARGDYNSAVADLTQAIQLRPDNPVPYFYRGNLYALRGGYDEAIADFDKAIQLKPDSAETYYSRGKILAVMGNLRSAVSDLNKALELSKDPVFLEQTRAMLKSLNEPVP